MTLIRGHAQVSQGSSEGGRRDRPDLEKLSLGAKRLATSRVTHACLPQVVCYWQPELSPGLQFRPTYRAPAGHHNDGRPLRKLDNLFALLFLIRDVLWASKGLQAGQNKVSTPKAQSHRHDSRLSESQHTQTDQDCSTKQGHQPSEVKQSSQRRVCGAFHSLSLSAL